MDDNLSAYVDWLDTAIRQKLIADAASTDLPNPPDATTLARSADDLQDRDLVLAAYVCQSLAAQLAPTDPSTLHRLGELAHIVGRRGEARRAYERYSELHPDDEEVRHLLTALQDGPAPSRVSDRCLEQLYGRFACFYDENMTGELAYCAPTALRQATASVRGGRARALLDLGCGTGLSGDAWRHDTECLVGVDLSPEMVARARSRCVYDRLDTAEITAWLSVDRPERYDVIIACDSLIYFADLDQVVDPATRFLEPNGVIGLTVERGDTYPFQHPDSGRFTHHPKHVKEVVSASGLTLLRLKEQVLRYEYGEPVIGLVVVCQADNGRQRTW